MNKKTVIIQIITFGVIVGALIILGSGNSSDEQIKKEEGKANQVEIYYFYSSQRCAACVALENYTREVVNEYFSEELKEGKIKFESVNVNLSENKEVVTKYQARGSSLYINNIYNNEDHITEEVNVWRYLNNKNRFENYLSEKIKGYFN